MGNHEFASFITGLFESGEYSDVTITCRGRKWNVHRAIICPQSSFFKAACTNGFVESQTRTINLLEDDPDIVGSMLYYLYTHEYRERSEIGSSDPEFDNPICWGLSCSEESGKRRCEGLLRDIGIYTIADKYDIQPLKAIAMDKFKISIVLLAALPPKFPSVYRSVCNMPSENSKEMRELVAVKCAENLKQILASRDQGASGDQGFETHVTWSEVLADDAEMTFSLLDRHSQRQALERAKVLEEASKIKTRLVAENSRIMTKLTGYQRKFGFGYF